MKTNLSVLVLAGMVIPAWAQSGCLGQLQPLKPISAFACGSSQPLCLCGPNGTGCHWEWACSDTPKTSQPAPFPVVQTDPSIIMQLRLPQIMNPSELLLQAAQIRLMRAQAAALEAASNVAAPAPTLPDPEAERRAEVQKAWMVKVARAKSRFPDYDQTLQQGASLPASPNMARAIQGSNLGPEVIYWLAKHPEETRRIALETTERPSDSGFAGAGRLIKAYHEIETIEKALEQTGDSLGSVRGWK